MSPHPLGVLKPIGWQVFGIKHADPFPHLQMGKPELRSHHSPKPQQALPQQGPRGQRSQAATQLRCPASVPASRLRHTPGASGTPMNTQTSPSAH